MSLGATAPLLFLAHDWSAPVERVRTIPTAVIGPARDGTEQRQALSHLATDVLTYRLIAPSMTDAMTIRATVEAATDAIVRMPRWEDQSRVPAGGVSSGVATLPCDTTDRPTFVSGAQVMVWRSPTQYEIAVIGTVSSSSLGIVDPLVSSWAEGSIVVPITACRVRIPVDLTHWAPTSGALSLTVETSLADLAGVGTGGTGSTGTPAAVTIVADVNNPTRGRSALRAVVTDAAGNTLPATGLTWSTSDPTNAPIYATTDPAVALIANPNDLETGNVTVTAILGALSDTATAWYTGS